MICPNCGNQIENQSKFCAVCGAQLPAAAPPAWAQTPPPAPTVAAPPAWAQTPPPPFPPGAYYAAPPATSAGGSAGGMGGLLALVGGAIAIGSAWLPWSTLGSDPMKTETWSKPIDLTNGAFGLANGNYLVAAGAVAAICGLLLVLGIARTPGLRLVLAAGAIAGAVGVGAVELSAYTKMSEALAAFGSFGDFAIGWGLYVGAGGAVLAGLGGLATLGSKPGTAGSSVGSQAIVSLLGAVLIVALAAGAIYEWPQISKQFGGAQGSPSVALASPSPGSFMTSGYSTPELAINQYVNDQSYTYGGDCASATPSADYCSSFVNDVSNGRVYAIGRPASEPAAWVLMRQVGATWYMVDVASAGASSPAPWH